MVLSNKTLLGDLKSFSDGHFGKRSYFICNYGSYASGTAQEKSDLDVFFATPDIFPYDLRTIQEFFIGYHQKNNLKHDEEVPYENKLLASYLDVDKAVNLEGLDKTGNRIRVPPIIKEKAFLASIEIRYRLLFNALTSPHSTIGNDLDSYRKFKNNAGMSLVKLAKDLLGSPDISIDQLAETLFRGPSGEEGELWLGYKRNLATIEWVRTELSKHLSS